MSPGDGWELKQRLAELTVVKSLVSEANLQLKPRDMVGQVVQALALLFPQLTVVFVAASLNSRSARRVVAVHTNQGVTEQELASLAEQLREAVQLSPDFKVVPVYQKWQTGDFDFEFMTGEKDDAAPPPVSTVAVPLVVPDIMVAYLVLAVPQREAFGDRQQAAVQAVLNTAAETVRHLRRMLDREEAHLKEIELMRRDFMNIAAHDLRTPITAIKGFVQMIRQGELGTAPDGEIGEALSDIELGTDRMIGLVNDFLTISRFEQGTITLSAAASSVNDLLVPLVRQLKVTVERPEVELVAEIEKDMPQVMADQRKIAQVVTNLVDNALKHTQKGRVVVIARPYLDKYVEVAIADTGTGIAPEDVPHIFERYFRGKKGAVAAGRGGGLGLGLYIVKLIIEKHGGRVWADSTLGKGSVFHFTLPVVK